jgi:glucan phosphoethanolaminetransferase (alkaline phosphatase superfamily)
MIRCVALDIALWLSMPCAFLLVYVLVYSEPAAAIAPHLELASLPLLAIFLARLVLARSSASHRAYFAVTSTLTSIAMALLVVYYMVVLIGLHSWGGVVAWNVVPTFFLQTSLITEVWKIPRLCIIAAPILVYWCATALCRRYFDRVDWVPFLNPRLSNLMFTAVMILVVAIIVIVNLEFWTGAFTAQQEPLSVTAFPQTSGMDLEGYVVNPVTANRMDLREDAARESYVGSGVPAKGVHRKNLVFILVDALRPDHMGLYGYYRDTTPNLSRIAREHSTRIMEEVHSTCADTACSIFSLFSSQFPGHFAAHPFMLHHVLWRNDYRIHLILSGDKTYFYSRKQYYGDVDTFYDGTQAPGYYMNDDQLVIDKLARMPPADNNAVMFHFHLMSAHILGKRHDGRGPFQPEQRYLFPDSQDMGPGGQVSPATRNFYDNGVVRADAVIGELLALLKDKGYLEDALVVITADHGESLGEHGLYHHANSVREEVLRVPLVMIAFGRPLQLPATPRTFASQVDIAPTILRELHVPQPGSWVGQPLESNQNLDVSFFTEHAYHGLIDHRNAAHVWKYSIDQQSGVDRVFDLSLDPHEDRDLRDQVPAQRLQDWRARLKTEMGTSLPVPAGAAERDRNTT